MTPLSSIYIAFPWIAALLVQCICIFGTGQCIWTWWRHFFPAFNSSPSKTKWPTLSQTTFLNAFSWIKMLECWFRFHWNVSIRVQITMGKFDWAVRYVIIFLYAQFWIRLGTVSYRGKKVRTVDSPAVRSVNKSRDTRNCVRNEPKYAICVLVATRLYYKSLGIILSALI